MRLKNFLLATLFLVPAALTAESKSDYPGVADPFSDPAQYEFSDEEKEDKEFFHLGRYMLLTLDLGAGIFSGGLGATAAPGFLFGGNLVYFFDKSFAFEFRGSFSNHFDRVVGSSGYIEIDTNITGIEGGFRYYFDTKAAPRAIAIANPFLSAGGGVLMRSQQQIRSTVGNQQFVPTTNFAAYAGAGVQFAVYRGHVYLGLDLRYHLVFFPDEATGTLNGLVPIGARAGDYMTTALTATYSF